MPNNKFNLLDDPWIPIAGSPPASLLSLFREGTQRAIAGDPVDRIVITRFLLAVTHAALGDIPDDDAWAKITDEEIAQKVPPYLETWRDRFFLYDPERPFLQFPALKGGETKSILALNPHISFGNNIVVTEWNREYITDDAEKVLFLLRNSCFALGGKKYDKNKVLSPGLVKSVTGKPGPLLGAYGYLHSFLLGQSILQTIRFNLISRGTVESLGCFKSMGIPFWEKMPEGEVCPRAEEYRTSWQGQIFPINKFFLLDGENAVMTEGIDYPNLKNGLVDPSITIHSVGDKANEVWCNTEKRPWRELEAVLQFLDAQNSSGLSPLFLSTGIRRMDKMNSDTITIWTGGIQVTRNQPGEQYLSKRNDCMESVFAIPVSMMQGDAAACYQNFSAIMKEVDNLSRMLYGCVLSYGEKLRSKDFFKNVAAKTSNTFWSMMEPQSQNIIDIAFSDSQNDSRKEQNIKQYRKLVIDLYDKACPNSSPRQMEAWVNARPFSNPNPKQGKK